MYQFGRKLGQGSYGAVYEATHIETQTNWAIKEVYKPAVSEFKVPLGGLPFNVPIIRCNNKTCSFKKVQMLKTFCPIRQELQKLTKQKTKC